MKSKLSTCIAGAALFAVLMLPVQFAAQDNQDHHKHRHYKLILIGTLGGPQSWGDPGHGAANINNRGIAAGVAETHTPDPFYPNLNPLFAGNIGPDRHVYHAFVTLAGTVFDLGGLPGGTDSNASFITENGLVTGQALNGSIDPLTGWLAEDPVVWKNGQIIDLGSLGGYEGQAGRGNSRGQVTGFTTNIVPDPFSIIYALFFGFSNGTQTRAFVWDKKHGMQDLGTLGGPDAFAPYINERGQVAGFSYTSSTPNASGFPTVDPFLWENGKMIDLGTLGGTSGGASDLNNRGEVVGTSNLVGDATAHAFSWHDGTLTDLGTLGGSSSQANAVNEAGTVAGGGFTAGDLSFHAAMWRNGVVTDLGTIGNECSNAFGINSKNQVVGQAFDCNNPVLRQRALLWEDGQVLDLTFFVHPGSGVTLTDVEKINDRGELFGAATLKDGESRAFLLIPCDEDHPDVEGCDYSMLEVPAAVPQTSSAVRKLSSRTLPQSLMRRMSRYHVPGLAFGPRK